VIDGLLEVDPTRRFTVDRALRSTWLVGLADSAEEVERRLIEL
jgi:hypothetical protein